MARTEDLNQKELVNEWANAKEDTSPQTISEKS